MDMEIREVEVKDLKPAPYNPRVISEDALGGLSHSIGEFVNRPGSAEARFTNEQGWV